VQGTKKKRKERRSTAVYILLVIHMRRIIRKDTQNIEVKEKRKKEEVLY
jgi:hypothetical protein